MHAKVAELADAPGLGPGAFGCGGSSPPFRMLLILMPLKKMQKKRFPPFTSRCSRRTPGLFCLLIILSALYLQCSVRTTPDKVWNLRGKIINLAEHLIDLPYRYGGEEIDGFDCSGFVYYVYDSFGIEVPRIAKKQARLKNTIPFRSLRPADLLAFKIKRRWHTAIYAGDGAFIHAPNKKSRVRKEKFNKFWKKKLKRIIRVVKE